MLRARVRGRDTSTHARWTIGARPASWSRAGGWGRRPQEIKFFLGKKTLDHAKFLSEKYRLNVLLFEGELELGRNRRILECVNRRVIDSGCRNNLLEFSALIKLCDVLVTSDRLALHVGYS